MSIEVHLAIGRRALTARSSGTRRWRLQIRSDQNKSGMRCEHALTSCNSFAPSFERLEAPLQRGRPVPVHLLRAVDLDPVGRDEVLCLRNLDLQAARRSTSTRGVGSRVAYRYSSSATLVYCSPGLCRVLRAALSSSCIASAAFFSPSLHDCRSAGAGQIARVTLADSKCFTSSSGYLDSSRCRFSLLLSRARLTSI